MSPYPGFRLFKVDDVLCPGYTFPVASRIGHAGAGRGRVGSVGKPRPSRSWKAERRKGVPPRVFRWRTHGAAGWWSRRWVLGRAEQGREVARPALRLPATLRPTSRPPT